MFPRKPGRVLASSDELCTYSALPPWPIPSTWTSRPGGAHQTTRGVLHGDTTVGKVVPPPVWAPKDPQGYVSKEEIRETPVSGWGPKMGRLSFPRQDEGSRKRSGTHGHLSVAQADMAPVSPCQGYAAEERLQQQETFSSMA